MSSNATIAKAGVLLIPSLQGITSTLRAELQQVSNLASSLLSDGLRSAAHSGAADIGTSLHSAAQQAAGHFNTALAGVHVPTAGIASGMAHAGAQGASAITSALSSVNMPSGQIAQATSAGAHSGMSSGLIDGIKAAGPKMLGALAAVGIGAAVKNAMQGASEMEKGNVKIKASLSLDTDQAAKAQDAAKALYKGNYGDSMEGVQEAVTNTLSSFATLRNGSTQDIQEVTKRALNMASVFDTDVARSTQVASQLITTGFAKDGVQAMDQLSGAMQKVPANVREDIVDALDEYSPFMAQLGVGGEKGISMLVAASAQGMYGIDKLGDGLKEFTIRSTDMSSASKAGYDAIGLSQGDMAKQLLAGGDVASGAFKKIVTGLQGIKDPVEQQTAALALFGTPLEDLGVAKIPQFLESLSGVPGGMGDISAAAKQMDADLGSTASGSLESFKRGIEVMFSEAATPLIKELKPKLDEATAWISANKDEIQGWIRDLAGAFSAVLVPALEFVLPIIKNVTDFLNENKEGIRQMMPVIVTLGAVIGGLAIVGNIVGPIAGMVGALWSAAPAFWAAATGSTAFGISLLPLIALGAVIFAVGFAIGTFLYNLATDFDGTMKYLAESMAGIGWLMLSIGAIIANILIGIVNMVPIAINAMINGVNGISGAIGIPPIGLIPMLPFIPLPTMATGGDIMGATTLVAGEKDPETIVNRGKMNALMDDVLAGKVGQSNEPSIQVSAPIYIQKGVSDNDETLAAKVALALNSATGAAWLQKRA